MAARTAPVASRALLTPNQRALIARRLDACAAIEIVHSRFENGGAGVSNLEKLADSISNGGLVVGPALADWRGLDFTTIDVTMTVNNKVFKQKKGGHPINDPLGVAVMLVNLWRDKGGVRAGYTAACGVG